MAAGSGARPVSQAILKLFLIWYKRRASRVAAICNSSPPIRHFSGDSTSKNRVGVVTSFESKESMRFALQQVLRAEKVHFLSNFVSNTPGAKEEVCGQLKSYRFVDRGTEGDLLTKRRGLSGKGPARTTICASRSRCWRSGLRFISITPIGRA